MIGSLFVFAVALIILLVIIKESAGTVIQFANLFIPLPEEDKRHLHKFCGFYRSLNKNEQREFDKRVKDFMEDKDFHGNGIKVTRQMRVEVSALAVQISFGLPRTLYVHFSKIFIHKSTYRKRSGQLFHGEVNPGFKAIILSWSQFEKGNNDTGDGLNLGLHEMAHALWVEDSIDNAEFAFLDPKAKANWNKCAQEFIHDQAACRTSIFRNYACTNSSEFFAATVEHFFERTQEFATEEPELYQALRDLLNQDPKNRIARL